MEYIIETAHYSSKDWPRHCKSTFETFLRHIDWGPQNVVAWWLNIKSTHGSRLNLADHTGEIESIRRFKQIQLILNDAGCCYPSMTGCNFWAAIFRHRWKSFVLDFQQQSDAREASKRRWRPHEAGHVTMRNVPAAASGVLLHVEKMVHHCNHLVDVSTHQKLLQPSASHSRVMLCHCTRSYLNDLEGLRFDSTQDSGSSSGQGPGRADGIVYIHALLMWHQEDLQIYCSGFGVTTLSQKVCIFVWRIAFVCG